MVTKGTGGHRNPKQHSITAQNASRICTIRSLSRLTEKTSRWMVKKHLENIADYGGMKATYRVYKQAVKSDMPEKRLPGLDYSPDQLLWIAGAHAFCIEYRDQRFWNGLVKNDNHSPSPIRVNGVFSGMKEFAADWNCPAGSVMNPSKKCTVY